MRPASSHCGIELLYRYRWQTFAGGGRHIRAECAVCGHYHHFAPQTPENVAQADANPPYTEPPRPSPTKTQQPSLFGEES